MHTSYVVAYEVSFPCHTFSDVVIYAMTCKCIYGYKCFQLNWNESSFTEYNLYPEEAADLSGPMTEYFTYVTKSILTLAKATVISRPKQAITRSQPVAITTVYNGMQRDFLQ